MNMSQKNKLDNRHYQNIIKQQRKAKKMGRKEENFCSQTKKYIKE